MLEIWIKKARQSLAEHDRKSWPWLRVLPPGVWMSILVIAAVGGRWIWLEASRPAHRQEITNAFGSVSLFYATHVFNAGAQMNHDGSQFTYVATSPKAYALFFHDSVTARPRIICEELWSKVFSLRAWPWSPDDRAFIYGTVGKLAVYSVAPNEAPEEQILGTNLATSVVWLDPSECAWLEKEMIGYAKKSAAGKWETHKLPYQGKASSLTAVGTNAIAWLQDDYICRLALDGDAAGRSLSRGQLDHEAITAPCTNDLALWLDASTLQQSNQSAVTSLADLSGKHNAAEVNGNAPSFNAPDSANALNGKGTVHFTASSNLADATGLKTWSPLGIAGKQPRSIFVVMRRSPGRSRMLINLGNVAAQGEYFGLCDMYDKLFLPSGAFRRSDHDGSLPRLQPAWRILEVIYDGKSSQSYVNGSYQGTVTQPFNTANQAVEIGLRTAGDLASRNAAGAQGDFAELLIYDRALTLSEQRQVEDYLRAKWFATEAAQHISAQNPLVWINPDMRGLTAFSYSPESGRFLLLRTNENGLDSVWQLERTPGANPTARPLVEGHLLSDVQWIGTNEFAYASHDPGHRGLMLADLSGQELDRTFKQGDWDTFRVVPDQKKLMILGNTSNEPAAAIWQYDLESRQLRSLVSGTAQPSPYAKNLTPFSLSIKLPSGRSLDCTFYPPAHFDRRRHYPLVLGDTVFNVALNGDHGRLWVPDIATCGAFVVIINRTAWFAHLEQWPEDIMDAYKALARDPCIDKRNVYVFGASAETRYMSELLAQSPGWWKGVIFLNPTELPDFSKSPPFQARPKILISAGGEEDEADRLIKYQVEALNQGVLVEYIIHPGEGHHLIGNAAQLERTRAMMHFMFEE